MQVVFDQCCRSGRMPVDGILIHLDSSDRIIDDIFRSSSGLGDAKNVTLQLMDQIGSDEDYNSQLSSERKIGCKEI